MLDCVSLADDSISDASVDVFPTKVTELTVEEKTEIPEFGCLIVIDSNGVTAGIVLLP